MRWDYYKRMALNYLREPDRIADELASARRRRQARTARLAPLPTTPAAELPVVVSLTSYGPRIARVQLAIRSIMDQTVRPNRVELWLGEDADGIALPQELVALEEVGLTIHRGVRDLKGHKKYLFSMREERDVLLVTIDDDLVYTRDTIESLVRAHEALPHAVVARRCHRMTFTDDHDRIAPYATWDMDFRAERPTASRTLLATTGAGTLYPPETFEALVADEADIARLALTADDLWMKAMELNHGIEVAAAPNDRPMPYVMPMSQSGGLFFENLHDGGNDQVLARLMDHFGLTPHDFQDAPGEGLPILRARDADGQRP